MKLSVVLATRNEEKNIGPCLESVKELLADLPAQAGEIVVADESSIDKTREIAKDYGAKVYKVAHEPIFHKTKQEALELAMGDWILQLDADERVTPELAREIKKVIGMTDREIAEYQKLQNSKHPKLQKLFERHQRLVEERDVDKGGRRPVGPLARREVVAFFIPRRNYFLGKPLIHAGVYPDGQIRLVKKGKAHFPAKSVHEQMQIDGEVAWLFNDLEHHDSPTLKRYLKRMNRYTDLHARELAEKKVPKNFWALFRYSVLLPASYFLLLYFRHKGFLDGIRGFLWSFFSAMHFPLAYFKYWQLGEV